MNTIDGHEILPENTNFPSLYAIGWGLARMGRFAGQTEKWYSVLAHSFTVADLVDEKYRADALLHDAAEVIVGDQVATWKNGMTREDESNILHRIYLSIGLDLPDKGSQVFNVIKAADLAARVAEADLLGHRNPDHASFAKIREDNPELYNHALELTEININAFPPQASLVNTHDFAMQYVADVNMSLDYSKVIA